MADEKLQEAGTQTVEEQLEPGAFAELMERATRPKTDRAKEAIHTAVSTLAEQALAYSSVVSDDALQTIESLIAEIDRKMSTQLNEILHNPEFQELEGAWRGLHHLVSNTETDEMLKIRVLNISKDELRKTLKKYKGTAWDQSPIFKKIYEQEYGMFGGHPYGCLVGDYHFDHTPPDVELLGEISKIAAAAHAPFIGGVSPTLVNMDSWQELNDPRLLGKIFSGPEWADWRALRESEDARFVGLAMPRFLSRLPYGAKANPVDEFAFEEDTAAGSHDKYTWANSAYAMAANINRAFKQFGWCTRIRGVESGGGVESLPVHTFPSIDGGTDSTCPTEIAIPERREKELADCGFMPLCHRKNSNFAAFIGAQSLQKPAEYDDPDATSNARLSAALPYLFASCRFSHYLKKMVYDLVGSFKSRDDMQRYLHDWILQYVDGAPDQSSEAVKAQKPLAEAGVEVEEVEGAPGYYNATFFLRPHYQLEGLNVSMRLVSRVPSQ